MNIPDTKRERFSQFLIFLYMIPFSVFVCINMVLSICQTMYMELYLDTEKPLYKTDSPLFLLFISAVLLFLFLILFQKKEITHTVCISLERFTLLWSIIVCLFIIFIFRVNVSCDSAALNDIVISFLNGDYSSLSGDGYLAHYPHQLGMIGLIQVIYVIFGVNNYIVLQIINVISILSVIYFLHRITEELFQNLHLQFILSVLCIAALPLYLYATFIYGDIPGLGLVLPAIYYLIKYLNTSAMCHAILTILFLGFSIVIKSNNSVIMVAFIIILLLHFVQCRKPCDLLFIVFLAITPSLFFFCINTYYAAAANLSSIPSGIPKVAWIAMGLQQNNYIESGWYNGYNWNIYTEMNYNIEATTAACMDSIKTSINSFLNSPKDGLYFFYRKFISQWNDPGFLSQITNEWYSRHRDDHSQLALYFIYGNGRFILEGIMNLYHFLILFGSGTYAIFHIKKQNLTCAVLPLCVLGGYLFHLLWEAKSRYALGYFILCIPMAAWGLWKIIKLLLYFIKNKSIKRGE